MEVHRFNKNTSLEYANTINTFAKKATGVKVYSLLAPTQIEFIENAKYKNLSSSQKETIDFIYRNLNQNISGVDAYSPLKENCNKYIYFKTDHHWTAVGAYYGYTGFMNTIDEKPVHLEKYETEKVEGFLGSTYSMTLSSKLSTDTIWLYKPFTKHEYYVYYQGPMKMNVLDMAHASQKNKYRIFLSGDRPLGKIITEVKNGKKIAVIKDSYGNAFIPFLIPHYEEIYIIDPRQFKSNVIDFLNKNNIDEVLFLNYVLATENTDFVNLIKGIMNK
jgi:hypothetical protein